MSAFGVIADITFVRDYLRFWHLTDLPAAVINVSIVIFTGEDY